MISAFGIEHGEVSKAFGAAKGGVLNRLFPQRAAGAMKAAPTTATAARPTQNLMPKAGPTTRADSLAMNRAHEAKVTGHKPAGFTQPGGTGQRPGQSYAAGGSSMLGRSKSQPKPYTNPMRTARPGSRDYGHGV